MQVGRRRTSRLVPLAGAMLLAAPCVCLGLANPPEGAPRTYSESEAPECVLIDSGLVSRTVRVHSLDGRTLTYTDEQGRRRQTPVERVMALVPVPAPAASEPVIKPLPAEPRSRRRESAAPSPAPPVQRPATIGLLELVDAQRIPGDLGTPPAPDAEHVAWTNSVLGRLVYPLEDVAGLVRTSAPQSVARRAPSTPPPSDTLLLTNGDQPTGFIAAVGDAVQIETESGVISLSPDRVQAARFSNPRQPGSGAWVWLGDGTAAAVDQIVLNDDRRITLHLTQGAAGSYDWSMLRGVSFDVARLRPLASLEPRSQQPLSGRRYAAPIECMSPEGAPEAPLDADDLLLPGPMSVTFDLPPGTTRLAGHVDLDSGAAPWGDCELVISVDSSEVLRKRLQSDQAPQPFNIEIDGSTLTVAVDAGRYGPIHDRVILHRPLLLVESER